MTCCCPPPVPCTCTHSGDESWCGPVSSRGAWGEEQYGSPGVGGGRAGDAAPSPSSTQAWRASSTEATLDPQSPLEVNAAASLVLSPDAGSHGPSSREGAGGRRHRSWSERGTPTRRASAVYPGATRSSRFGERGTKLEWSDGEPDAVDGQAAVGVRSGGSGSTTAVTGTSRNRSTPRSGVREGYGTPPATVTITKITPATGSTDGVRRPWARHREPGGGRNIFGWRREFEAGGCLRDPVEGGHEEGKAEQHAQFPPTPDSAAAAAADAGALAAGTATPTNRQRFVGLAPKEQTLERRRRGVGVRKAAVVGKRTQHVQPGGSQQQSIGSALLSGDVPAPSSLRPPSASTSAGAGGVPSVLLSGDEDPAGCWSSGPEGPGQSGERQPAADKAEDAAAGLRLVTPGEIRAAAEGLGKKERKDDEEETEEEEEEVKREAELLSDDTEGYHLRVALARIQYLENGWMGRVNAYEVRREQQLWEVSCVCFAFCCWDRRGGREGYKGAGPPCVLSLSNTDAFAVCWELRFTKHEKACEALYLYTCIIGRC